MSYEVILPGTVTLEALIDQVAHATWKVLAASAAGPDLYPGYYIPVRQAIEEHLMRVMLEEEDLGAAHGYRFAGGSRADDRLEEGIVRAVAARLPGVIGDVRVADVFERTVPGTIHSVLEPFLWFEGDDVREGRTDSPVPGPRASDRLTGAVRNPAGSR